jgi:hypothetical protein
VIGIYIFVSGGYSALKEGNVDGDSLKSGAVCLNAIYIIYLVAGYIGEWRICGEIVSVERAKVFLKAFQFVFKGVLEERSGEVLICGFDDEAEKMNEELKPAKKVFIEGCGAIEEILKEWRVGYYEVKICV